MIDNSIQLLLNELPFQVDDTERYERRSNLAPYLQPCIYLYVTKDLSSTQCLHIHALCLVAARGPDEVQAHIAKCYLHIHSYFFARAPLRFDVSHAEDLIL
jgi:hypothetical protein